MSDLTPAKVRAVRRYLDPHMHIIPEAVSAVCGVIVLTMAICAMFGVVRPLAPWVTGFLALLVAIDWIGDLVFKVVSERRRIIKITREGR